MSDDQDLEAIVKLVLLGDSRAADDFLKRFRRQTATIARLEAENAQMRSLISSRPDAPQAFWDENRAALESARQRVLSHLSPAMRDKP